MHDRHTKLTVALVLAWGLLAGCWPGSRAAVNAQSATPSTGTPAAAVTDCPVTPYAAEVLDPSFSGTCYHSGDLWAAPDVGNLGAWFADPEWMKVQWRRPIGTELTVEGRRLDGDAPPLDAEVSDGYDLSAYTFTPMTFPTAGCWEVTGRIPGAELRFVVRVHPGEHNYRQRPPAMPGPDLWPTLRLPLETVDLTPDRSCPVTPSRTVSRVEGAVHGDGPIYLQAIDDADPGTEREDGSMLLRWIVSPEAPSAFLARGVPINGAQPRFGTNDPQPETQFVSLLSPETPDWQIRPMRLTVPGPGCYALQIDAPSFTQVITLEIAA